MLVGIKSLRKYFYSLLAILVVLGSVYSLGGHMSTNRSDSAAKSCESFCLSHSQMNVTQNVYEGKEEDDKEPTPPSVLLDSPKVISLGLYGVSYALVVFLLYQNRRYLFIRQLRF